MTITALILAAGEGHRVGDFPKALLTFGDYSALQLVLSAVSRGGCDQAKVVLGAHAARVSAHLAMLAEPADVVMNMQWKEGQLSSLQAGLLSLDPPEDGDAVLLFPVDYPLVDASVVQALTNRWRESRGEILRIQPRFVGEVGHPILFSRTIEGALVNLPSGESARTVFRELGEFTAYVQVDSPFILTDLDTHEDWEIMKQYYDDATGSNSNA